MNKFVESLLTLYHAAETKGLLPKRTGDASVDAVVQELLDAVHALKGAPGEVSALLHTLQAVQDYAHAVPERRGQFYNAILQLPALGDEAILSEWLQVNTDALRAKFREDVRRVLPQAAVRVDNQFTVNASGRLVMQVYVREGDMERTLSLPLQPLPDDGARFSDEMQWMTFTTADIARFLRQLLRRIERGELFGAALHSHMQHQRAERLIAQLVSALSPQDRELLARYPDMLHQALLG